jgi:hypothetical protein
MAFHGTDSGPLVRAVAWLVLAAGIIAAFYIYNEYATIEVPSAFGGTTSHENLYCFSAFRTNRLLV